MIFSHPTRIDEYMVHILDSGPATGPELLIQVNERMEKDITKQAVYDSLRKLLSYEVVNKIKNHYSLNRTWIQKLNTFTKRHMQNAELVDAARILDFEDGDSVSYQFKNPFIMDITWGHLYDILYENNPQHQVIFNYHPHEWLWLARPETESYWLERFPIDEKLMLFSIGGKTFLDREFKKVWEQTYLKVNLGESYGLKANTYLSVVGDYIFEINISIGFEENIDAYFKSVQNKEDISRSRVQELSRQKYKSKLKLTRNKKKADAWRKRFAKDFHIPKPYHL